MNNQWPIVIYSVITIILSLVVINNNKYRPYNINYFFSIFWPIWLISIIVSMMIYLVEASVKNADERKNIRFLNKVINYND
jgi:hypothetical protein